MRSFVYLSSAKVEPLYAHIKEPVRKRLALAVGLGAPVLPVAPRVEAQLRPPTTDQIEMLAVVLAHLDEAGSIGSIDGLAHNGGVIADNEWREDIEHLRNREFYVLLGSPLYLAHID